MQTEAPTVQLQEVAIPVGDVTVAVGAELSKVNWRVAALTASVDSTSTPR